MKHIIIILSITLVFLVANMMMLDYQSVKTITTKELALQDCRDSLEVCQSKLDNCLFNWKEHLEECSLISNSQIKKIDGRYLVLKMPYEEH